ncbi:MAG: alpha/beta hydrolase fold domain-containing protein [Actinomycetota bacterium]
MRPIRIAAVAALLGLFGAACEVADPTAGERLPSPVATNDDFAAQKSANDVPYGPGVAEVLDIYSPANRNGGAILWIHGGGWADANGDPNSLASEEPMGMMPVVMGLHQRGWTVFSVRYAGTDEAPFPAQIHDVKLAMRWVRKNAARYGVAPDSVVAMGWSAGGHLAALLGVSNGQLEPTGVVNDLQKVSSRPAAAVSLAGVLDPATFAFTPGLGVGNGAGITALLGCPATPDRWNTCSRRLLESTRPSNYDDRYDPPLYIAQGSRDGVVDPYWQAKVPYASMVKVMGDDKVWLDMVDTGEATAGGEDPRNHTKALSYELNWAALLNFVDRHLPATPPPVR